MYKPKEFAKKIGVSVSTLRRWDKERRLVPARTTTNHRVYTDDDIFNILNIEKTNNQVKLLSIAEYQVTLKKMTYNRKYKPCKPFA